MSYRTCKKALAAVLALNIALPSFQSIAIAASPDTRTIDGSENNLSHATWGAAGTDLLRDPTQAHYGDGISSPSGADRPSPRLISNAVSAQSGLMPNNRGLSDFVWAWGQFVDHDLDLTDTQTNGEKFPIPIPTGDPFFDPQSTGTQTMPFSRSVFDPATGSSTDIPRQQPNSVTSFLDASNVYGSDEARAAELRTFTDGTLKTSTGDLLPFNVHGFPNAMGPSPSFFLAGDVRANEQPTLLSLHTLFVREHNRLAADLRTSHPDWTDEEIYQSARATVGALIEHITYDEFLPALCGPSAVPAYGGYDPSVNPGIATAFSTAAYRIGHTMISPTLLRLNENGTTSPYGNLSLRTSFFNPLIFKDQDGIDPIFRGLAAQKMQEVDAHIVDDLRNFLFGAPGQGGMDLASLNIQRGRDHGIPGYNQARRDYGLQPKTSFSDITSDTATAEAIRQAYGNDIEKVDLWVGGLAEDHLSDSSIGETFTTIMNDQFLRTRSGDRFWYENQMSPNEISQIKSTTLADVIRRNTEISAIQDNVFFVPGANPEEADEAITQTVTPLTVKPHAIALSVTVKNNGPHSGTGIVVTETLPEGLTFSESGSTAGCSQEANVVTCSGLSLGNGQTTPLSLHFDVSDQLCATNVSIAGAVHGAEADSIQSSNAASASTYFACPNESDVQLTPIVSATSSVLRGFTADVTVGASNDGPATAENVTVSLPLPPDFTLQAGSACGQTGATIVCGPFTLAAGQTQTFSVPFDTAPTMTCPSHRQITATVASGSHDYYTQDDTSSDHDISVECAPEADLSVSISGPATSERGTATVYSVTAKNAGPGTVQHAVTRLPIETGMTFIPTQSSEECVQNGTDIECTTSLSPTGSKTFSVAFQSLATMECATVITQHASISTTGIVELNPSDNTASAVSTTVLCAGRDADGSKQPGANTPSGDEDPLNRDRPRTSHSSSHRGTGLEDAMHALEFIARNHGMNVGFTARNHLVASATQLDVPTDSTEISKHDLEIVCSMKRYLNESPERHTAEHLTDWAVDQLSMMLGYNKKLIRAALTDDSTCK